MTNFITDIALFSLFAFLSEYEFYRSAFKSEPFSYLVFQILA